MRLRLEAVVTLAAALSVMVASAGDPDPKAKATAALAIAQAQRTREHVATEAAAGCYDDADYKVAQRFAEKHGKPMLLWVGMRCADLPELRKALAEAVHCHLKDYAGDDAPRLVAQGTDGTDYVVRREKIADWTAAKIKAKWAQAVGPPLRPGVRVSEEFSRKAEVDRCRTCGAACDCYGICVCDREAAARAAAQPRPGRSAEPDTAELTARLMAGRLRIAVTAGQTGPVLYFRDVSVADWLAEGRSVDEIPGMPEADKAVVRAARVPAPPTAPVVRVLVPRPAPAPTFSAGWNYSGRYFRAGAEYCSGST